ncbi:MAG: ATP-dependent Clp protease proteolytic subunit [Planctomyces sp.]|nr:ATP-dependent Clp protease proteolytic subunit [Planctomyces sp.]
MAAHNDSARAEPSLFRPAPGPLPAGERATRPGDWEVVISGDLLEKSSDLAEKLTSVPRRSRGVIWFDSGGGSVYVGLALASIIRLRGLDAAGVVAGECSSAALLPFAACPRRFVTPHSTLLFHPIRWQSDEHVRLEEAAEWARHFQYVEADLDRLISRMFDFQLDRLTEWTRPGRFVTGAEMVDAGLARMVDLFAGDVWSQMEKRS